MHFADKWVFAKLFCDLLKLNVISDDLNYDHVSHQMLVEFGTCALLEAFVKMLSCSTDAASLWLVCHQWGWLKKLLQQELLLPNFGLMVAVEEALSKQLNAETVEQILSRTMVRTVGSNCTNMLQIIVEHLVHEMYWLLGCIGKLIT